MSSEKIHIFDKEKLNKIFSFIDQNKWNEAKTIWVLDFLRLKPTGKNFDCFSSPFDIFGEVLSSQQKYKEELKCEECHLSLGSFTSDFYLFTRDSLNELFQDFFLFQECTLCRKIVKSKLQGIFNVKPAFLYCETFYKDNTVNLNCYQLPRYLEIRSLTYKLLLAQIKIKDHFKGIFLLSDNFFLIDDLQNKNKKLKVPKDHKVVCCLYYLS